MTQTSPCPICQSAVQYTPRYPRRVCDGCARQVRAADGRALIFFNTGLSGGLAAQYADTAEEYPDTRCYIAGAACRAEEGRFGGVVIQTEE